MIGGLNGRLVTVDEFVMLTLRIPPVASLDARRRANSARANSVVIFGIVAPLSAWLFLP